MVKRRNSRRNQLIIIPEILRSVGRLADHIDGIACQQRARLRLIIRRDIVGLLHWLAQHIAIAGIGALGANEYADAVLWLGIKIADIPAAKVVNYKAVRRQRVQRLFSRRIVGKVHLEAR
jgi:hypothetical protein